MGTFSHLINLVDQGLLHFRGVLLEVLQLRFIETLHLHHRVLLPGLLLLHGLPLGESGWRGLILLSLMLSMLGMLDMLGMSRLLPRVVTQIMHGTICW